MSVRLRGLWRRKWATEAKPMSSDGRSRSRGPRFALFDSVRLLFVCKSLPYSFKGGIQTHVWELTRYLMARGCEVTILTGGSLRRGTYRERHGGRELIFLPYLPGRRLPCLQKSTEDISFNAAAYVWLRRHARDYDIVHVQGRSGCFYASVKRPPGAPPVLTTFHRLLDIEYAYDGQATGPLDGFLHRAVMGRMERRAARHTDHAVAVSGEMQRELVEAVPRGLAPVSILPNGVSEDYGRPDAEPQPWRLCFVGRLERIKGVYHLLEAISLVDRRIRLEIVGEGPERAGLERAIAGSDDLRTRVSLLGDREADGVRHCIQSATALVLPSFHESQGIVLIEAGICGRPVIGARAPGIDEVVVHGETGLLYTPGDAAALAAAIDHVFAAPEVAAALGAGGRRRARNVFNWTHISEDTYELYRALRAEEAPPRRAVARVPRRKEPAPARASVRAPAAGAPFLATSPRPTLP